MRRLAILAALPLALSACSGGGADGDADGEITAEEAMAEMEQGPEIALEPGQWEQSVNFTELDMPGAPDAVKDMLTKNMAASVTSQSCLGPDDVTKPDADFFAGQGNGNCTYREFDRNGSRLKLSMTCEEPGQGASTIAMEGEFGATEYAFDVATTVEAQGAQAMSMKGRVTARRIGECPA